MPVNALTPLRGVRAQPWDADCEYPKSANPECQDFNEAKGNLGSRPNGYGYVALSIFACGGECFPASCARAC